jgi:hypothetical protein
MHAQAFPDIEREKLAVLVWSLRPARIFWPGFS